MQFVYITRARTNMDLEKQLLSKHIRRTASAISFTSTLWVCTVHTGRLVTHPKVLLKFGRHFDSIHHLLLGKSKTHSEKSQ